MLVLSLFPGIGLLDRAFEEEGFIDCGEQGLRKGGAVMPRIVISTIDGEVVKIIDHDDIGELSHPIALADIADEIRVAVAQARRTEKQRWSPKDEVRS